MCRMSWADQTPDMSLEFFVDFEGAFYFFLWEVDKNRLPGNLVFGVDVFERERLELRASVLRFENLSYVFVLMCPLIRNPIIDPDP